MAAPILLNSTTLRVHCLHPHFCYSSSVSAFSRCSYSSISKVRFDTFSSIGINHIIEGSYLCSRASFPGSLLMLSVASAMQGRFRSGGFVQEDTILRLATYLDAEAQSNVGLIFGEAIWPLKDVVDLQDDFVMDKINDMYGVISHWDTIQPKIALKGDGTPLSLVKLQAPLPKPTGAIMCIGKNYADHVKEVDTWKVASGIAAPDIPKHPIVFTKAPQAVIGNKDPIIYPSAISSQVDYEAELAVIIGKEGRGITKDSAMSHVFGYTILNDVTARDLQKQHQQWFLGKSCDTFCPMGPCIVPASCINGQDLQIQCWVNGELRQNGRTSQMIFSIPELIETISAGTTLKIGDVIATGTPAGVGSGFNPPKHLSPGDIIRISIEGIGILENHVK
ncbi:hypothetical protein KP509_13G016700 [Ceratopteris richardii]|uniref:Fumarylacetoacetase-like C-terminal domain-containing protein n=3 Tax=Ceratopteris richardii TaxID=49495 RepID=A0A8T2TFV7_CERRI|nr:hypothetical protein KP509_13G016700 [Ceratopteris richardii]